MESATPHDIIFSCSLCQATISDIYAETESSKGLQDSTGSTGGVVTKLWLAECAHLTCSSHLEGGGMLEALQDDWNQIDRFTGVPFYRGGCHPRAICPVCAKTKDDHSEKRLYGIRGIRPGEYDVGIPDAWFQIPSIELDANSPSMEALRFQYLALLNYGRSLHEKQRKIESEAKSLAAENDMLQGECRHLKRETSKLKRVEEDMKKWEARKPAIEHYLGRFTVLANENKDLRAKLRGLGYDVPHPTYAIDSEHPSPKQRTHIDARYYEPQDDLPSHIQHNDLPGQRNEQSRELPKVFDSVSSSKTLGHEQERILKPTNHDDLHPPPSNRKRKASRDLEPRGPNTDIAEIKRLRMDSRQMMPPPKYETFSNRHQRIRRDSPTKPAKSPQRFEDNEDPDLLVFTRGKWENIQEREGHDHTQRRSPARPIENPSHSEVDVTLSALKNWPLSDISPGRQSASRRSVRAAFKSPLKRDEARSSPPSQPVPNRRLVSSHFHGPIHYPTGPATSRGPLPLMHHERRYDTDGPTTLHATPPSIHSLREHFEYQPHDASRNSYPLSRSNDTRDILVDSGPYFRRSDRPQVLTGNRQHLVASPFFDRVERSRGHASNKRFLSRAAAPIQQPDFGPSMGSRELDRIPSINALSFIDEPHSNSYEPLTANDYHYADLGEIQRIDGLFQRPTLLRSSHREYPTESQSFHNRERTTILPSSTPSISQTFRYDQTPRRKGVTADLSAIRGARTSASRAEPARVNLFGGPGGVFASGGRRVVRR